MDGFGSVSASKVYPFCKDKLMTSTFLKKHKSTGQSKSSACADDQQLLTVRQVAALDNCSEKTVRRAIKAGLLEAVRVGPGGRLLRIYPAAHERYRKLSYV